jgi:hypothetical protein
MQDQLTKIERQVNSIHEALIGNEYNGEGLIDRVKKVEKYQESDKRQKWTIAGVGITIGFILKFWDKLIH